MLQDVVDDKFVGRQVERDLLESALLDARDARPRVALVHGPAGMGKSALLRRFLGGAEGVRVLSASGDEVERALAYGVVAQLVAGLPEQLPDVLASVTRACPTSDPLTVGAAIVELLGQLQEDGSVVVVVVVDDAHWADTPSLQALVFALRRLRVDRVLALVAARDEELESLPAGLHRLLATELGARVGLGGLPLSNVRQLAASFGVRGLAPATVERLAHHTGSSPLHLRALLAELPISAFLADDLPAPRSFSGFVLSRLASCPADAEALVVAASVLGLRCPLGLAARVGRVDEALAALEAAVDAGLLELSPTAATTEVVFTHPLVRAAVYHDLGPARRAALHARAAEFVEDEGSGLRHRVAATPAEDPTLAAEVEDFARREARRGAWSAAAAGFLSAARLASTRGDQERRLIEAVDSLLLAGEFGQAFALGEQLASFSDGAYRRWALGQLSFVGGRLEEAEGLLLSAWEGCDPRADPQLAARIAAALATIYVNRGLGSQTVEWARRALDAVPELHVGVATPPWLLVVGLAASGRAEEAIAMVDGLPQCPGDADAQRIQWISGRGTVRMWADDLRGAKQDLSTVAETCRRRGPFHLGVMARFYLSETEYRLGRWDDAFLHGELAVSAAEDADQAWMLAIVHAVAAFPLAGRGEWERAEAHVLSATEAAAALGPAADITWAAVARARLSFAAGDYGEAAAVLAPLPELAGKAPALEEPNIQPWRELYGEALVRLGSLDEAEAVLVPLEALAATRNRQSSLAGAARVRAMLQAARGRHDEARVAFEAALGHAAWVETPFEHALLDDAYGRFLRRAGERRRARERLVRAQEAYARLRARPYLERVERELAACGLTPARRSVERGLELTPQELAVARLVAAGKTNREAAAELVVSAKTVGYHLGNVYTKLGVSSRAQLAARFAATGG